MNAPQTNAQAPGDVLPAIDMAIAEYSAQAQDQRDQAEADGMVDVTAIETAEGFEADCAKLRTARVAVAQALAERDALREVLREFQDGRRYSNPHTRQVARDIEQTALARVGGE